MDYSQGKDIWNNLFNIYKNNIDSSWYDFIFKNVQYAGFVNDLLFLKCPNEFLKDTIEEKDLANLQNIIDNDLNLNKIKIKIIIHDDEMKNWASGSQIELSLKPSKIAKTFLSDYTFENFVQGKSNEFAYSASVSVADKPAFESDFSYNPLFIHGGVGLGKTHLMHAIANRIDQKNKGYKIKYVSSETFTNDLIESIRENKPEEFRNKYRSLDIILIDDIQFLAGKEGTQEEFFHTFNSLHSEKKQIVISSDRPPREIKTLEDRLKSRFEQGLIVDINPPDFETRVAILKNKAISLKKIYLEKSTSLIPRNFDIPDEAYLYIARNIKSNIRELEGALIKIFAQASFMNVDITFDMIKNVLKDTFSEEKVVIDSNFIKEFIAKEYNIRVEDLTSKKRTAEIAYPRQIAMYLCRELTDMSLPKIGKDFKRDHSTVIHAYDKIVEEMKNDERVRQQIEDLKRKLID